MPLNREEFKRLEERIVETLEGKRPLMEVPCYICLYNPKDELEVLENFSQMVFRLKKRGYSAESIKLSGLMIKVLEDYGFLSPHILEKEEEIREELERDLRRILSREIPKLLGERLRERGKEHCAIILRYSSVWPFVHLSSDILPYLEGIIKCTLVIPYPSTIGEGYPLDMKSEGISQVYRAEVVDLR